MLFNVILDCVLPTAMANCVGIRVDDGQRITDLDYADDFVLLADNHADLQIMLNRRDVAAGEVK